MSDVINVAFVGNPNCGKTTLFNDYTGARLKVANYPGVTVEKKEGAFQLHQNSFKLVDLPGIYSLTSYTMEERLARKYVMEDEVDVIVDVADASSLERNLFLTLSLIELGKPVVLALNMMDIVIERGMEIDTHRLPEMLGIPVIGVSARKKTGLDVLMHAVAHHKGSRIETPQHHHHAKDYGHAMRHMENTVVYSDDLEQKIDLIIERIHHVRPETQNPRYCAIMILSQDKETLAEFDCDFSDIVPRSYEADIINQKYDFIEEVLSECVMRRSQKAEATDRADAVLTHRIWGMPLFLCIMAFVFFLTFTVGDLLKGVFTYGVDLFSGGVRALLESISVSDHLISLLVDGIIGGVGGILSFLPNIFILFLALAFLEDSGYMSRVAYVMDSTMSKIGLSGRAFIPMLLGFGCSVPAIMATRTLERRRDKLKTMLVTPYMSCSARLPIYVLFSEMFFGAYAPLAAFSMYIIGVAVAIITAKVLSLFEKKEDASSLLIELPEYKMPNLHTIAIYVWEKVSDYLTKAGTTIFFASIVVWLVLNIGPGGFVDDIAESFGAIISRTLVPVFSIAGLGYWQIILAIISGVAAKEVVVSSLSVLYGTTDVALLSSSLGAIGFAPLNAYAMMTFCLLYIPCVATIATIKRESNSQKFMLSAIVMQLLTAYVSATLIYQIGKIILALV